MSFNKQHDPQPQSSFENVVALAGIIMLLASVVFLWYMAIYLPGQPRRPDASGIPIVDSSDVTMKTAVDTAATVTDTTVTGADTAATAQ